MALNWIQKAVRVLHSVQDSAAAITIGYTQDGVTVQCPARLDMATGESVSLDGLTTYFTERAFKVTKANLPFVPQRGDRIELPIYNGHGQQVDSEFFVVMSEAGLDVVTPQGNYEDAYKIYAKRVNNDS